MYGFGYEIQVADSIVARSGSVHLRFLLDNRLIKLTPSPILDTAYSIHRIGASLKRLEAKIERETLESGSSSSPALKESDDLPTMLLSPSDGRVLAECLDVEEMEQEVERAIHQVEGALKAKNELEEEKHSIEIANKKSEVT